MPAARWGIRKAMTRPSPMRVRRRRSTGLRIRGIRDCLCTGQGGKGAGIDNMAGFVKMVVTVMSAEAFDLPACHAGRQRLVHQTAEIGDDNVMSACGIVKNCAG